MPQSDEGHCLRFLLVWCQEPSEQLHLARFSEKSRAVGPAAPWSNVGRLQTLGTRYQTAQASILANTASRKANREG